MRLNLYISLLIRLVLGGAIVSYVFFANMVSFASFGSTLFNSKNIIISWVVLSFIVLLSNSRWYILNRAINITTPFVRLFKLTMIGNFFNTVFPGTIGGDIVKAWYIKSSETKGSGRSLLVLVLDRVMGMAVTILVAGAALVIWCFTDTMNTRMLYLSFAVWGIVGIGFLLLVSIYFSGSLLKKSQYIKVSRWVERQIWLSKVIKALGLYKSRPSYIFIGLLISILNVILITGLMCYLGRTLGVEFHFYKYLLIVPIGLVVTSIPLLPGGVGVGQAAFFTLFYWAGSPNPELGGTLITLLQVYGILFNCMGSIFYFINDRKVSTTS